MNFRVKKEKFSKIKEISEFLLITNQKNNKSLAKITEVTEPQSTFYNQDLSQAGSFSEFQDSRQKVSPFLLNFLQNLQKFDQLLRKKAQFSLPALKLTRNIEVLEDNLNQSDLIESRRRSSCLKSMSPTSMTTKNINYSQILSLRLEKSKNEAKTRRLSSRPETPMKDLRSIKDRNFFKKDQNDQKVKEVFLKISGAANTVNSSNFSEYLKLRYPALLVEPMIRHFDFQFESYENYLVKVNRFISSSDKLHLKFCFDLFDLNRDGFICYQDTFKALEIRKENLYDEDFVVLQELLQLKFEGKLVVAKKRRKSTFGLIRERIEKRIRARIPVPPVVKDLTTRINFAEFKLAKFLNKPQVLRDFFKYVCAFNYSKVIKKTSFKGKTKRKDSENIVIDMNLDENYKAALEKDSLFAYYCELDEVMAKYEENNLRIQLEKFKFLQSTQKFMYRVITKESMIENFVRVNQPKLIGFNSEYLSQRMFEFLSKGQYLTKARFLSSILPYQTIQSSTDINNFAFNLLDSRKDGKITVDEISALFHSLPLGSPAYCECLKIVNIFLNSIFEKRFKKISNIDFNDYQELIEKSCIGEELIKFLQHPVQDLVSHESCSFSVSEPVSSGTQASSRFITLT